jgi:hypothetical protein
VVNEVAAVIERELALLSVDGSGQAVLEDDDPRLCLPR